MNTLLVLAAGMGSRYGGLKQLDPVGPNDETLLDFSVYDAARSGFARVVFVIRRDFAERFKKQVGSRYEGQIDVAYAYQALDDLPGQLMPPEGRTKPWGTAHAVWAARNVIDGPFAVVNADDFYGRSSYAVATRFLAEGTNGYALVGFPLGNTLSEHGTVARGLCTVENGMLQSIVETTNIEKTEVGARFAESEDRYRDLDPQGLVSMNLWALYPSFFDHTEQFLRTFFDEGTATDTAEAYIPSVIDGLITSGRASVRVLRSEAQWFGVTYPEDKPAVEESLRRLVEAGNYPDPLWT